MEAEIEVQLTQYSDRPHWIMRYLDPITERYVSRSAGTANKSEAAKAAGKWQAELREGRYQKPARMTWLEFVEYHDEHRLAHMTPSTATTYDATLNKFKQHVDPKRLANVTTAAVTTFATALRREGLADATVARHLRHLRAIINWAHSKGLLAKPPKFDMPRRATKMKGRPITDEEFHIMLSKVEEVVGKPQTASWQFLLRGYWASGLRLNEALHLSWCGNVGHVLDFSRRRPMFRICGAMEKGNKDRLLPMAPEFAELLEGVDLCDRLGPVFEPLAAGGNVVVRSRSEVGKTISDIGKAAGIVVDYDPRTGEAKKYASTQDLRRAFGFRWSKRVMPPTLMRLMRHEKIETTMVYYVGDDADQTAEDVWDGFRNKARNSEELAEAETL